MWILCILGHMAYTRLDPGWPLLLGWIIMEVTLHANFTSQDSIFLRDFFDADLGSTITPPPLQFSEFTSAFRNWCLDVSHGGRTLLLE